MSSFKTPPPIKNQNSGSRLSRLLLEGVGDSPTPDHTFLESEMTLEGESENTIFNNFGSTVTEASIHDEKERYINSVHLERTPSAPYQENIPPTNFRRLQINTVTEVPLTEEQEVISKCLVKSVRLRAEYMDQSFQRNPKFVKDILHEIGVKLENDNFLGKNVPVSTAELTFHEGVFNLKSGTNEALFHYPSKVQYYKDLKFLLAVCTDGPTKSFCFRRMRYLENQFELHTLLNEMEELTEQKKVPHRDFYNVRKVDTHVHLASCMNQKHLLRFIKMKLRTCGDEIVINRNGKDLTLKQVFESLNLTAYDLSVDTLDMHADRNTFQRFDKFNLKYNPIGESRLREIFMKTNNKIKGRYFAELVKQVISDLDESKYQHAEYRASIYGRSHDEWSNLADWIQDNNMISDHVMWMVQIPRLYNIYHAAGQVKSFSELIENIFRPLFEVTLNPEKNRKLYDTLLSIGGFDCVDDESKPESQQRRYPDPEHWTFRTNPPYSYYVYYIYANLSALNQLRACLGLNTFQFRPHCGEAGPVDHLASAFLCADGISHGILLRKVPVLEYLYYLTQVGIAMSPLSNNNLFLEVNRNPMPKYFAKGLNISLSSDDPLQFHFTKEPLIEEYSVVAQLYKLSACDLCELARNSVLQSSFPDAYKRAWIGENFDLPGPEGNEIAKTNVPDIRIAFRHETLTKEWDMLSQPFKQESSDKAENSD